MDPSKRGKRYAELQALLLKHPAKVHHFRWESIKLVHAALGWNEQFLLDLIDFSTDLGQERAWSMMGMDPEQRQALKGFWLMFFLHLANYTSMNQTLIDHVRNLMRHYEGTEFASKEQTRRATLSGLPVTGFLKDLRNYITHHTTPPLTFQMHFSSNRMTYAANLDAVRLLEWGGWKSQGRAYLSEREAVVMIEPVHEYRLARSSYYDWLFSQFELLHGDDLRNHDELVTEQQSIRAEADRRAENES